MKILLSILIYTVISTEIETIEDEVEVSEKEHIEIVDNASAHKELAQSKFFWTSESEEETPSIPWKPRVDKQNFDRQWQSVTPKAAIWYPVQNPQTNGLNLIPKKLSGERMTSFDLIEGERRGGLWDTISSLNPLKPISKAGKALKSLSPF